MNLSLEVTRSNSASVSWTYLLKEVVLILTFIYLFLFNGTAADFVNEPVLKITFGLLTVVVLGAALGQPASDSLRSWHFRPWWAAALIAAAWFNYWMMEPLFRGVEADNSGQWSEAAAQLALAAWRDPGSAVAWQQLGIVESVLVE